MHAPVSGKDLWVTFVVSDPSRAKGPTKHLLDENSALNYTMNHGPPASWDSREGRNRQSLLEGPETVHAISPSPVSAGSSLISLSGILRLICPAVVPLPVIVENLDEL
jgi:hypothetical protein